MSKLFSALITSALLFSATSGVHAADTVKNTVVEMKDKAVAKMHGERNEEKMEDRAEAMYESNKEKAEEKYDAAREKCESQTGAAERTCKQQARTEYKSTISKLKEDHKKAKMDAHNMGETPRSK